MQSIEQKITESYAIHSFKSGKVKKKKKNNHIGRKSY